MPTIIPWCDETINPWVGCTKVRAGCKNCYAERLAYRLAAMGQKNYKAVLDGHHWNGKIAYQMEQLEKLKHWRKSRRIFWCSMSDMFHKDVPFEYIDRIHTMIALTPQHTHLILTKRIDRAAAYYKEMYSGHRKLGDALRVLNIDGLVNRLGIIGAFGYEKDKQYHPFPNLHLVISCSTQKDLDEMAPVLFQIPASVRGLSAEPLLDDLDLGYTFSKAYKEGGGKPAFDHVIVGCEKLAGHRPGRFCEDESRWWQAARSLKEQCVAAGVAFYMKQGPINGKVVTDPAKFPEDLQIREYPK